MASVIRMKHIRSAKLCSRGARQWFEDHGLSWQSFLDEGVPVAEVLPLGDAFATRVAEIAMMDNDDGR